MPSIFTFLFFFYNTRNKTPTYLYTNFIKITDYLLEDLQASVSRPGSSLGQPIHQHTSSSSSAQQMQYLQPANSTTILRERSTSPNTTVSIKYCIMSFFALPIVRLFLLIHYLCFFTIILLLLAAIQGQQGKYYTATSKYQYKSSGGSSGGNANVVDSSVTDVYKQNINQLDNLLSDLERERDSSLDRSKSNFS